MPPSSIQATDRVALVALFRATGGPSWRRTDKWNTDAALSKWYGVEVNDDGRVVKLSLEINNLKGPIPKELGNLDALRSLNLDSNRLSGTIPAELAKLSALQELFLSRNDLSGTTPAELGDLRALQELWLDNNRLTGPLPPNDFRDRAAVRRWREALGQADVEQHHSLTFRTVKFQTALWHFMVPVLDDISDVWLLLHTAQGGFRGLWWTCLCVLVFADIDRLYTAFFSAALTLRMMFHAALCRRCGGVSDTLSFFACGTRVELNRPWWVLLDSVLWTLCGSRARSSAIMQMYGMAGESSMEQMRLDGFGVHAIDEIIFWHPFRFLGEVILAFPNYPTTEEMVRQNVAHRRTVVLIRAIGETLCLDILFLILSVVVGSWEDDVTGVVAFSALFSILELITELQYYVMEAEEARGQGERVAAGNGVIIASAGGSFRSNRPVEIPFPVRSAV